MNLSASFLVAILLAACTISYGSPAPPSKYDEEASIAVRNLSQVPQTQEEPEGPFSQFQPTPDILVPFPGDSPDTIPGEEDESENPRSKRFIFVLGGGQRRYRGYGGGGYGGYGGYGRRYRPYYGYGRPQYRGW